MQERKKNTLKIQILLLLCLQKEAWQPPPPPKKKILVYMPMVGIFRACSKVLPQQTLEVNRKSVSGREHRWQTDVKPTWNWWVKITSAKRHKKLIKFWVPVFFRYIEADKLWDLNLYKHSANVNHLQNKHHGNLEDFQKLSAIQGGPELTEQSIFRTLL